MNIRMTILTSLLVLLSFSCSEKEEGKGSTGTGNAVEFSCVQVDPMQKIYLEDSAFTPYEEVLPYAKGETAAFQFVVNCPEQIKNLKIEAGPLSNGASQIESAMTAFESYITAGLHFEPASNVAHFPVSDKYPDCLKEVAAINVTKKANQPLWVNYEIPKTAEKGVYEGEILIKGTVGGQLFTKAMPVSFEVKDVVLPEQTLRISNWHNHTYFSLMNNGGAVPLFSDIYFSLLTEMVHVMRDHGQNVYWLHPLLDYVKCDLQGNKYTFDFTNMDKTIEVFIREGNAALIEGGHLAKRINGEWEAPFGIFLPNTSTIADISAPEAQLFINQFIPALEEHLRAKGWWEMYAQHVADEPYEANQQSYVGIVNAIKKLSPSIRVMDAIHALNFPDCVDIWVPLLNLFADGYQTYKARQKAGDELWFYTCLDPKGNYANRLLEQPLIQMRILHWMNFKYGATGYLHWGFNQAWTYAQQNIATEGYCPGGDMFIAYPSYNQVFSSIRLEAMRDGIHDYELLKMLEAKNPAAAKEIVDAVVYGFDNYNNEHANFRKMRIQLLDALEK